MAFTPYLNFGGNCRDAFTAYHEIFGGDLTIMSMGDAPGDYEVPEDERDRVMNAQLVTPTGDVLMGADGRPGPFGPVQHMYASCTLPDAAEAARVWAALSDGGEVDLELTETFWSPAFGVCVDRFGTPWMVNADQPAADA